MVICKEYQLINNSILEMSLSLVFCFFLAICGIILIMASLPIDVHVFDFAFWYRRTFWHFDKITRIWKSLIWNTFRNVTQQKWRMRLLKLVYYTGV